MKKDNKTENILIRCTPQEKEFIKLAATLKELNVSEYLINSSIKPLDLDKKKSQGFLYEINKIGVNLNQLVRKINQFEITDEISILQYVELISSQLDEAIEVYKGL